MFTLNEDSKLKSASRPGSKAEKTGDHMVPPEPEAHTNRDESQKSKFMDSMLSLMDDIEEEAEKEK